jgi:hyaluronan synthase
MVDSDTILEKTAVEEGLRPFSDPKIQAVCGNIRAYNRKKKILTRLIDLRYCNAFQYEISAYSVLGSVLYSSGVFSFWKTKIVQENLENYLDQKFMGSTVTAGDDRHLTFYALQKGKVVFQETAKSLTMVPENISNYKYIY